MYFIICPVYVETYKIAIFVGPLWLTISNFMLFDLNTHTHPHTYKIHMYTCMMHLKLKIKNKCILKSIWKVDAIFIKGL